MKKICLFFSILSFTFYSKAQTETEPNNTPASADTVTVGSCLQVAFNSNTDEDYFKITLNRGGVLIISTANIPANNRPIIEIYTQSLGGYIHNGAAPVRGSEAKTETILAAGTYYIKLRNFYSVPDYSPFSICFELDTTDPAEPDNSPALAKLIPADTCFKAKMRGYYPKDKETDIDWYKISVPKDGVLQISITQLPPGLRLHLKYFKDDLDDLPDFLVAKGLDVKGEVTVAKGIYYFRIEDYSDNVDTNAYKVCLSLDTSDQFEFNNIPSKAKNIPFDSCVQGKIMGWDELELTQGSDIDFFSFTVNQGGEFTANVSVVPQEISMKLSLYDSSATMIALKAFGKGQPASLTKEICKGKYYIQLSDIVYDATSNNPYKLCLSFKKDEDCGKDFPTAFRNNICDTVFASFKNSSEEDYFRFTGNGKNVTATVTNIAPNIIAKLTAYDRDEKIIGSPVTGSGIGKNVSLTIPNTISGDSYYILAENSNNATSGTIYRFIATDDNCKSAPVGVSENSDNDFIKIYPNPSNGEIFVSVPDNTEQVFATITDAMGAKVFEGFIENTIHLQPNLPNGIYFITLNRDGILFTQKIILTR